VRRDVARVKPKDRGPSKKEVEAARKRAKASGKTGGSYQDFVILHGGKDTLGLKAHWRKANGLKLNAEQENALRDKTMGRQAALDAIEKAKARKKPKPKARKKPKPRESRGPKNEH
jgi:hypothetical protein